MFLRIHLEFLMYESDINLGYDQHLSSEGRENLLTEQASGKGGCRGGGVGAAVSLTSESASRQLTRWWEKLSTPRQRVATTARPLAMASSTGMPHAS